LNVVGLPFGTWNHWFSSCSHIFQYETKNILASPRATNGRNFHESEIFRGEVVVVKLPANLHIVRDHTDWPTNQGAPLEQAPDPTSDWLEQPERWDRAVFIAHASDYLRQKNGLLDTADAHLLSMLASQIEIYVESILKLRAEGLVMAFNGGVTVGPNPYMAIADRALYRSLQVMKELELSPKARDGYQSARRTSSDISSLFDGP